MILRKIGKIYPLLNVLKIMANARPLGVKQAFTLYTAPLRWIAYLGNRRYNDFLPSLLVLNTKYGMFCVNRYNIGSLFQEVYEVDHILPKLINKDTVFVDVGAYMGFYTVWACRRVRRVVAVEPNPQALVYLKANIALNKCSNVHIVPKAASDKRGVTVLSIPRTGDKRSVLTTSSIVWRHREALEVEVKTDTLDNILEEAGLDTVDVVKIDVEGAEGLVVRGAAKTLSKARAVLIEIWPENLWILKHLNSIGYKLTRIIDHRTYKNYVLIKG